MYNMQSDLSQRFEESIITSDTYILIEKFVHRFCL